MKKPEHVRELPNSNYRFSGGPGLQKKAGFERAGGLGPKFEHHYIPLDARWSESGVWIEVHTRLVDHEKALFIIAGITATPYR